MIALQEQLEPQELTALDRMMARWEIAKRDPIGFMKWFVFTADQHDKEEPCKRFPWHLPHIQYITRLWQANQRLSLLKSRQMKMTWLFVILSLWEAIFHKGRLIMLQSKREEDAIGDSNSGDGLIGRAKYIMEHMPFQEQLVPGYDPTGKMLRFRDTGSTLWAIPQGGSIIRQRTASGIFSDEAAFQPDASDAYTAAGPCIRGGGWFVSLTTPDYSDGGHTRRLHEDTLSDS